MLILGIDFEEVQEDLEHSPDSREFADDDEYCRRELPRHFRAALEGIVHTESQPIEERLRSQLMAIIRDCQDRVFLTYRESATTMRDEAQTKSENMNNSLVGSHTLQSSPSNIIGRTGIQSDEQSRSAIPSISPLPSPGNPPSSSLQLSQLDSCASSSTADKRSSDSGYGSNGSITTSTNAVSLENSNESADILNSLLNPYTEQQVALGNTTVFQPEASSETEMPGNVTNNVGLANVGNEWGDSWMPHYTSGDLDLDWPTFLGSGQAMDTNQIS